MSSQPPNGAVPDPSLYPDLPIPPINSFLASGDVMKGAEDTSYLARLTPEEAKKTLTRTITMYLWTDKMIDEIVQDARFGYLSKSEFLRHAVEMLLEYYQDNKHLVQKSDSNPAGFINDMLRQTHMLRLDAERARIRKMYRDNMKDMDDELQTACSGSDFEYIANRLQFYRDILRDCGSESQREEFRKYIAASVATRSAVAMFFVWTHSPYRGNPPKWDDAWVELSETWNQFYVDQAVT